MAKSVYKIECEWEVNIPEYYTSQKKADDAIDAFDWSGEVEHSLAQVRENGLVSVVEIDVH